MNIIHFPLKIVKFRRNNNNINFKLQKNYFSSSKILKPFPSHTFNYFKDVEHEFPSKYTPYTAINETFKCSFDSQIIFITQYENQPKNSPIYQTNLYKEALINNKVDKETAPIVVPENRLVIAVVNLCKENLHYLHAKNIFALASSSSFLLFSFFSYYLLNIISNYVFFYYYKFFNIVIMIIIYIKFIVYKVFIIYFIYSFLI